MAQRILTLSRYLFRSLLFSLSGLFYVLVALAFWRVFFDPAQGTPEAEYYILVIGIYGAATTFLVTLSIGARAYRAVNYPLLVRLPSRVEHLTAVLTSGVTLTLFLQLLVAVLATFRGPSIPFSRFLEIPPLWISANILASVLALHASDLVAEGWSRVYVFGSLAILLFGQSLDANATDWLAARAASASSWFLRQGWASIGSLFSSLSRRFSGFTTDSVSQLFGFVFWPFHAISDAVVAGSFRPSQALAPAILLLYATVLFLLAADLFSTKDLFLSE